MAFQMSLPAGDAMPIFEIRKQNKEFTDKSCFTADGILSLYFVNIPTPLELFGKLNFSRISSTLFVLPALEIRQGFS